MNIKELPLDPDELREIKQQIFGIDTVLCYLEDWIAFLEKSEGEPILIEYLKERMAYIFKRRAEYAEAVFRSAEAEKI